jgi:uncharacterized damage-inducible protein DinB
MTEPRPFAGTPTALFAEYNRWMNEKIYAAAATLSDADRKKDLGAFFKSLHGTLNHLLWGDTAWLSRFTGTKASLPPVGTIFIEDFAVLSRVRAELDGEIIAWAASVTEEWLRLPCTWTSKMYERSFTHPQWAMVAQMFNHQTHHRGQVTTLLMQLGVDPGVTDIPLLPLLNE